MDLTTLIETVGVAIAAVAFILTISWRFNDKLDSRLEKIEVRLSDQDTKMGIMDTKLSLFWNALDTNLAAVLHSPHTPELDRLLFKLASHTINLEEITELDTRMNLEIPADKTAEGAAAATIRARITQLMEELKHKRGKPSAFDFHKS